MVDIARLVEIALLVGLTLVNTACSQTCYHCNYFQASSTDPGLQTVLGKLSQREPSYTQCGTFPYYSSGSVPTVNCATLNMSMYGAPLGGMPFTGWMCMKQSFTVTLKNYGDGNTVLVPATVRGCVPYQYGNPYSYTQCYPLTDSTNPYVRAVISSLYFPENNVGPVSTTVGGGANTNTNSGQFCMSYGSWSNSALNVRPNINFAVITLTFISLVKFLFTR